ncbi:MAG TPA: hypothetical protein VJB12_03645, partial [Candidatus Nanoarchaeia archaeon]|nr:hypothetical protein [Candidatus Nanoarchaeia archaeon]
PACIDKDSCQSDPTNPLQLYATQQSCESSKYCFFDRSRSSVNLCYSCEPQMSCYDYKSQGSCERDNCGASNCQWKPLILELGSGVCVSAKENNCKWCDSKGTEGLASNDAHNVVYEGCTREKANILSTASAACIFTGSVAKTCDQISCSDITSGCPTSPVMLTPGNKPASRGECATDICMLISGKCKKDADANQAADCATSSCEADIFAPSTILTPILSNGTIDSIRIDITDKTSSSGALVLRSTPDYITYICKGSCPDTHPFSIQTQSQRLEYSNRKLFDPLTRQNILNLSVGENTIRFYSQDPQKNLGEIRSFTFIAPSTLNGPKPPAISIPGASVHLDTIYAGSIPSLNALFLEPAQITFAQLRNPKTGDQYQVAPSTYQGLEQTDFSLSFSSSIPDGTYLFELNAKNPEGVFMSKPLVREIVVDSEPPLLINSTPLFNSVIRSSPVSFSLGFERETTLLNVSIDGKDVTSDFSTINNLLYRSSLNISDGNKVLSIRASSFAGVISTTLLPFVLNARPIEISLKNPPHGVSPIPVFDVLIETDNNAECKYDITQERFTKTGQTIHNLSGYSKASQNPSQLIVTCRDLDPGMLSPSKSVTFTLSHDSTPPILISLFADPDPIQDIDNLTRLSIQADEASICKYSKTQKPYSQMEPFDTYAAANFSIVSRQPITQSGEGRYSYFIACENKAGLISSQSTLNFSVNYSLST